MNVVFLARLYWPHVGGVEKHLSQISQYLKSGHSITIVTEQFEPHLPLHEVIDQIEIWRIPLKKSQSKKWQIWRWWLKHLPLLFRADVIHIHDVFFWILPLRILLWPKQVFITFHGYEGHDPSWKEIFWHRLAAFFTEGSLAVGRFHQKWYGVNSDVYTYGGVELENENIISVAPKTLKLIFVGRLASDTGILEYLRAVEKMSVAGHHLSLSIFGTGPLLAESQKRAARISAEITFHPPQKIELSLLRRYSVALVSGYLTILEALAAGIPVIALTNTDSQIKSDYLYMTPFAQWLTIANTAEEVASALQKKLSLNPAAQQWASQQTWAKVAELYTNLWKAKQ
jgi:glycosyltransferase involved in cell wall biosynthesis